MVSKKNSNNQNSNSPLTLYPAPVGGAAEVRGEPVYLSVGYLRRAHGVKGDLIMEVLTDFPERLRPATNVLVGKDHQPVTIESVRKYHEGLLVKFVGFNTPEAVSHFRNRLVYVTAADRPKLPEGQFYHHELIGFDVVDEKEVCIGNLNEIVQTGANDVYVVKRRDGNELLLPVIASVVLDINVDRRLIRVHLMDGLIEESQDTKRKS